MEAVFFRNGLLWQNKTDFQIKFWIQKKFCENEKNGNCYNKELSSLEKVKFLASVGSTAPFIGLFGTVWGIMNSFTAIVYHKIPFAVVAPGSGSFFNGTRVAATSVLFFNKLCMLILWTIN